MIADLLELMSVIPGYQDMIPRLVVRCLPRHELYGALMSLHIVDILASNNRGGGNAMFLSCTMEHSVSKHVVDAVLVAMTQLLPMLSFAIHQNV